jgi:hypothetical protein
MEHICHHEPNSILIVWLSILLAMVIERLYHIRLLHRGTWHSLGCGSMHLPLVDPGFPKSAG